MNVLRQIEQFVSASHPQEAALAPGGATDLELHELSERVGKPSPSLEALLRWRNGCPGDLWLGEGFWFLLPTREIVNLHALWTKRHAAFASVNKAVRGVGLGWPRQLVPFATWNGDVFAVVDVSPGGTEEVYGVDIEGARCVPWAKTLQDFFQLVLNVVSKGDVLDVDDLMEGRSSRDSHGGNLR